MIVLRISLRISELFFPASAERYPRTLPMAGHGRDEPIEPPPTLCNCWLFSFPWKPRPSGRHDRQGRTAQVLPPFQSPGARPAALPKVRHRARRGQGRQEWTAHGDLSGAQGGRFVDLVTRGPANRPPAAARGYMRGRNWRPLARGRPRTASRRRTCATLSRESCSRTRT